MPIKNKFLFITCWHCIRQTGFDDIKEFINNDTDCLFIPKNSSGLQKGGSLVLQLCVNSTPVQDVYYSSTGLYQYYASYFDICISRLAVFIILRKFYNDEVARSLFLRD